jgi:ribonuclease P protein component
MAVRPPSLKTADFQSALGSRPVSRTQHFTLHVLLATSTPQSNLSTGDASDASGLVDDPGSLSRSLSLEGAWKSWRLGLVLPKKQARRSVTRSLIRHQAREALRRHAPAVAESSRFGFDTDGWVVRLRAPFDVKLFPSAASQALNAEVRRDLDELWMRVSAPASAGPRTKSVHSPADRPGGAA